MTFIIGIAGPSGSGKTTLCKMLYEYYGITNSCSVAMDNYYYTIPANLSLKEAEINHPKAFDLGLLSSHLEELKNSQEVESPVFDFPSSSRSTETKLITPKDVVIVEGLYALREPVTKQLDIKIYIDVSHEKCLERKLERDVRERNTDRETVLDLHYSDYIPMFDQYLIPTKIEADIVVDGTGDTAENTAMVVSKINKLLENKNILKAS